MSKLVRNNKNLEHASKVIKHTSFNRVHKKELFTCNSVLMSIKLEMSCTVAIIYLYNVLNIFHITLCIFTYIDFKNSSLSVDIHQLMNIVPHIQEKWSEIGTMLKFSPHKLNEFWQRGDKHQIPVESRKTFCCIQMLQHWVETSDSTSIDELITAINVPYIGLGHKIPSIKAALRAELSASFDSTGEFSMKPPEKFEQSYIDMKANFCKELSKSQHRITDILLHLQLCEIKSEIFTKITDLPTLVKALEKNNLLNKTDLSWLKYIATSLKCSKAIEIVENYETLLFADKIIWSSEHPKGTYLVGKISKNSEFVTIKDSSDAKSVASRIVQLKETDSMSDFYQTGSVIVYWKVFKDVTINIPNSISVLLARECKNVDLTHIGILMDGRLNLKCIDELTGIYISYNNKLTVHYLKTRRL